MNAVATPALQPSLLDLFANGERYRLDISNEAYHADRSCVSVSGLKKLLQTGAHFRAYLDGPRKETPTQMFGTAAHARVLEPLRFPQIYAVAPTGDRRTKEFKEFKAANDAKKILTVDEAEALERITVEVFRHTSAATLLKGGLKEVTIVWQDPETGVWLKIRPDCLSIDFATGICLDLKTTDDASAPAFVRQCKKLHYDLQAAVYLEGLRIVFGRDFDFAFLAAEDSEPHGVALYGAPEEMLESGRRKFRRALARLVECRQSNRWPGYQPDGDYEVLEWPRWAQ